MRRFLILTVILGLVLAGCHKHATVAENEDTEVFDGLASINRIFLGSFGSREGSDLIKEKIRFRLIKSKRFTVVERQDLADATLTGSAHIEVSYSSGYHQGTGGGATRYSAQGVLRLVSVKNQETIWLFETISGNNHKSASGFVADKTVDKLLKDAKRADEKATTKASMAPKEPDASK